MVVLNKIKNLGKAVVNKTTSQKPATGQYIVGLDIGTEFVKALVAKVNGNKLEIVGTGRAHQELSDMQAGAISDIAGVVANCDQALTQAEQEAGVSARTAIIGIAGELVKGHNYSGRPPPKKR